MGKKFVVDYFVERKLKKLHKPIKLKYLQITKLFKFNTVIQGHVD